MSIYNILRTFFTAFGLIFLSRLDTLAMNAGLNRYDGDITTQSAEYLQRGINDAAPYSVSVMLAVLGIIFVVLAVVLAFFIIGKLRR